MTEYKRVTFALSWNNDNFHLSKKVNKPFYSLNIRIGAMNKVQLALHSGLHFFVL